jgi:hypothetical protein
MKFLDTLLLNGMTCHHQMENQVDINMKGRQYSQLSNE